MSLARGPNTPRRVLHRAGAVAVLAACAFVLAPPVAAQVPLPPLPSLPGQPPDEGDRPPQPAPPPSGAPAPAGTRPGSVALGVNAAHTGHLPDDALVPPLVRRWRASGRAKQLLAAEGLVFAVGQRVSAYRQSDGRRVWTGGPRYPHAAAYDAGLVFVAGSTALYALDATTGATRWQQPLDTSSWPRTPVAGGGAVFAQGSNTMFAFRGADGSPLWSRGVQSGNESPALDGERLYVAAACGNTVALRRSDGEPVWRRATGCHGGASEVPALFGGRLYHSSDEYATDGWREAAIFDASSGTVVGRHRGGTPVFVDDLRIHSEARLVATDISSGRVKWRRRATSRPVAIGHDVYGVRDAGYGNAHVVGLDAETGAVIWRHPLQSREESFALGAAPGLLLVASGGRITAYESLLRPRRRGIAVTADRLDVVAGDQVTLVGVLGRALRGGSRRVGILSALWRRERLHRIGAVRASRDGGFAAGVRIARNARLAAAKRGSRSRAVTVYAHPRVRIGRARHAGPNRIRVAARVRAPGVRFGHRRFSLYLQRAGARRMRKLATARLSGRPGRARAILRFRPVRRVGRRDTLAYCIRGQLRLALGRPSALTRRCGARRLPAVR